MAVKSIKNSVAADRFHASFSKWVLKTGKKQVVLASELGMSPSGLNNIIKKRAMSLAFMEEIAGKINLDLADMLQEGRAIVEGEIFAGAPLSARNSQDKLPGDLLANFLDFRHISNEDVSQLTGITPQALDELLDSKRKPSFDEMEALYNGIGLNPAYFYSSDEALMWWPEHELQRLFFALGKTGRTPDCYSVADIFDISEDDAQTFLDECKQREEQGKSRVIPPAWLEQITGKYNFAPSWVHNGHPPLAILNNARADGQALATLRTGKELLQAENKNLTDDYREAVRRQNQLQDKLDTLLADLEKDSKKIHQP